MLYQYMLDVDLLVWSMQSRQVSFSQVLAVPIMLDQSMLDVDMLVWSMQAIQVSFSKILAVDTVALPHVLPRSVLLSLGARQPPGPKRERIRHVVPGVPVTPLDSNLHDTGAKVQGDIKVGIFGLDLNPNRRKFGWFPAKRQVGGKERCWPNSLGQPIQGCHPSTIYNHDMPPPPHPSGVKVVPS